jgi:flagellin
MPSVINTNISSMNAQRNLSNSQNLLSVTMERLSSGLRVNTAKDDAAGLSIATRMTAQIRGTNVAVRNANDGISLVQTAEGSLGKSGDLLQRMRELAVQAANGSNSASDKTSLNAEYRELAAEVQRIYEATTFNGIKILSGGAAAFSFQVGANTSTENQITATTTNMTTATAITGVTGATVVLTGTQASILTVVTNLDTAIDFVSSERSKMGAAQSRFDNAISYLQISNETQSSSRSRIMDADYAQETATLSRAQILSQAGTAMVSQSNQMPQSVLSLLRA